MVSLKQASNMTKNSVLYSMLLPALLSGLLLLLIFSSPAFSTDKIVKWKDEKGNTNYGDNVPAQYSGTDNSVINKQGITIKHNKAINKSGIKQDEALEAQNLSQDKKALEIKEQAIKDQAIKDQLKKDKALLNSFTNADEIDLARDRNLQLDIIALEGLQLQLNNSLKRLAENQKFANSLVKKHQPVPVDLSAEIKSNQAEIAKQNQSIIERKATMESTRKRFNYDKIRFIELKK